MDHSPMPGEIVMPQILQILLRGESCLLTVTGCSMIPFLRHKRDSVLLSAPKRADIAVGRIVLFQRLDGSFILHRIRRIRKDGSLLICGDAQSWTEVISPSQILAVVTAVQRETGRMVPVRSLRWRVASALWYPTRPFRRWMVPLCIKIWTIIGKKL